MRSHGFTAIAGLITVLAIVASSLGMAEPSYAAAAPANVAIAKPAAGGRTIYVSPTGSDDHKEWKSWYAENNGWKVYPRLLCLDTPSRKPQSQETCPAPTAAAPLKSIEVAIRIALPGDVIVVRAGNYDEAIGWGARAGTKDRPIVLQAYPGERPTVRGTLILKGADYWTVLGLRFTYNPAIQSGQAVVALSGGTGWTFTKNEVTGSPGVANLLIVALTTSSSATTAQRVKAAPNAYTVSNNCITRNVGKHEHGTDHNIYLMSSIYSTGGVIERNLLAGASNGANIKMAASSPTLTNASPRNVTVRYNTMLYAASGATLGLKAEGISLVGNLIAFPSGSQASDGGIKTYQLQNPGRNAVKDSLISGYSPWLKEDWGVKSHIFSARNVSTPVTLTGSVANCTLAAVSPGVRAKYGTLATK